MDRARARRKVMDRAAMDGSRTTATVADRDRTRFCNDGTSHKSPWYS